MGFSMQWICLTVLSCLLCMGGEVRCDCTEERIQIAGGHYTFTKQLNKDSMLIYQCPDDYYPYPHLTRMCQPDGSWRPPPKRFPPQKCKVVECPDPNVLQNGNVSPFLERYFVHNETTYECYSGYTLKGSTKRVCLPNGKWSGSTPICSRDTENNCADPGIPAGTSRTGDIFGIDNTVKYSCIGNLLLVGSEERLCQENGQWTGIEPTCYYRHTYDTSLEVSESFGSAIRDSLTILEPSDETQLGRKIRIPKHGTLNIYIGVDISESIEQAEVDKAINAITVLISKISSFSVTPNYEIVFFSSEVFEVVKILDFLDKDIKPKNMLDEMKKFKVDDKNTGTDLNLLFKTFLERMSIMKQRVGDKNFEEHRHVLMVFTDGAYNMGGSPDRTVQKIKNMVYLDPTGQKKNESRDEYLDIYIFGVGKDILDTELMPLTAGKDGKHYFRMKDITNLNETFDEIIDEEEVKGLCGLHKEYEAVENAVRKKYPWSAFIRVEREKPSNCIGSLVTSKFILTAAHCFKFGDLAEHVKVEIGDGGISELVEEFKLHPNYNNTAKENKGVKEFYDYDVALIQLKNDVKISNIARPICIPCTIATSNALQLVGASTCRQQEEILLKNHLERLNFLTKRGNTVALKEAHAKLGGNRGDCIRHALEAPGITTANVSEVVTDNFICTGGRTPFRDHIACHGDSGGAVFKNYERRTIQVALVSWGNEDLCGSGGGVIESGEKSRDFHINLFRVIPFLKSILGKEDQTDYTPLEFLPN
ncbi:complement factor B-like isoform X2 [Pungitius pungitius]|uniref:complement factor B-like isoform X2 n=1 Tax=Pungitius pungitius TaxID=134920 RepID=UPI002E163803